MSPPALYIWLSPIVNLLLTVSTIHLPITGYYSMLLLYKEHRCPQSLMHTDTSSNKIWPLLVPSSLFQVSSLAEQIEEEGGK
jgi:hypothetical protein